MARGFGGIPGGGVQGMMQQARKVQEQIKQAQEKVEAFVGEGQAGGGAVRAKIDGKNRIRELSIDPELVNPAEVDLLQDTIISALNDAVARVEEHRKELLSAATGGISVPGLF